MRSPLLCSPARPMQVGLGGLGAGIVYKAAMGQTRRRLPVPPAAADERVRVWTVPPNA